MMFESSLGVEESKRKVSRSIAMCDFTSRHRNILLSFPSCGEKKIFVLCTTCSVDILSFSFSVKKWIEILLPNFVSN